MRLLAVDVGAYTQDILLLDTSTTIENCIQMIMPSATVIVARRMQKATQSRQPLLLGGVTMGGGANTRALRSHLKAGLKVYAIPEAAASFDDDIEQVASWGVTIVSEDEARRLDNVDKIEMKDLDLEAIGKALQAFGVEPAFDAVAVAVLDHGAAPKGESDRIFRFQHLRQVVEQKNELIAFAHLREEIPAYLTRMKAVAKSLDGNLPLLLLDTGAAAALGALEDPEIARQHLKLIANMGNLHTLAFLLEGNIIQGLFEHHTGLLPMEKLDAVFTNFAQGNLTNDEVFRDKGHGCFILSKPSGSPFLSVTGPQRGRMKGSRLKPYFAAPYGDMMLTGCFGLVCAFAHRVERWQSEIAKALAA